ncbi:MAG: beta-L-arabinofuranosidase domain-containing protein [bacterium]
MRNEMNRREFVGIAASAAALMVVPRGARGMRADEVGVRTVAEPFALSRVRLRAGTFLDAAEVNQRYLLAQSPDRLLHTFRIAAGLPTTADPLGGWEAPVNELRGHFTGHYLSACALGGASLGDAALTARAKLMVAELAKCQQPNGYLSAFPEEFFDRLRDGRSVWAPFYTLHKIMAGMLDVHLLTGNGQALEVVTRMATWVDRWSQPLAESHMQRVLEREFGGMNEVLYNLSAVTGSQQTRDVAHRFDHERVMAPLAAGRDELKGVHANTTVPKIIGAARRYELTGDTRSRDIADYFYHEVTTRRAFATGGTSSDEEWPTDAGKLSKELSGYTQESCVTYNMQKLARHVFSWTGDVRVADYYERAMFNGIIGVQNPADGEKLYYTSLESGYWKLWGPQPNTYWCCTGSMAEAFAKLGDSIYFHDADGLYVNQFIASELDWKEKGLRVVQATRIPESHTSILTMLAETPVTMALRIRIPYWATKGGSLKINGRPVETFAAPSSYLVINRIWKSGDTVEITLPMSIHSHAMPDDPTVQAVMYGPIVLAARQGTDGLTPALMKADPTPPREIPLYKAKGLPMPVIATTDGDVASVVRPAPGAPPLEFLLPAQDRTLALSPLYKVRDERYAVYFKAGNSHG